MGRSGDGKRIILWGWPYAGDEQIYASDKDPVKLEMKLQCQLLEADQWFGMNGMITNPDE